MAERITVDMIKGKVEYINGWLQRNDCDWRIAADSRNGGHIIGLQMVYASDRWRTIRDLRYGPKAELFAYLCGMMDMIR